MLPHCAPGGSSRSGSPLKSVPVYPYSSTMRSWSLSHQNDGSPNFTLPLPTVVQAMIRTHLGMQGSLALKSVNITWGLSWGTCSKRKHAKMDPKPNYFNSPCRHLVSWSLKTSSNASTHLNTMGAIAFIA